MNPFISQVASKDAIELMAKFFEAANEAVKRASYDEDILEAFDLIQAISCFRYFPTVEQCVEAFPSLVQDRHKVDYIWKQFQDLSPEQLSDIYISSLHKLNMADYVSS